MKKCLDEEEIATLLCGQQYYFMDVRLAHNVCNKDYHYTWMCTIWLGGVALPNSLNARIYSLIVKKRRAVVMMEPLFAEAKK